MTPSQDADGSRNPDLTSTASAPSVDAAEDSQPILERLYTFRFTFVAIFCFLILYTLTIRVLEGYLHDYYKDLTQSVMNETDFTRPIATQIQFRLDSYLKNSTWTSLGGVDVSPIILGRDGSTLIYVAGKPPALPPERYVQSDILAEAERLLPATAFLSVSVPHNSVVANIILLFYAGLTMQVLWLRNLTTSRRQRRELESAVQMREHSEQRTRSIEAELDQMRQQLHSIEPTEPEHISEVGELRQERKGLEEKLAALELRELELRESAAKASALGQEIGALEDLLEEASEDLAARDTAIRDLEKSLKRASKNAANAESSRVRESETLSRRFGALYRNLEIDDRALQDFVALRDEGMKLQCEEKLKRLNDEADNVSVRRKVGGIPPHLTVFEMGFAGKGRLYYMKGAQRRFRVLNIGAKNTQNAAIEYLRKL